MRRLVAFGFLAALLVAVGLVAARGGGGGEETEPVREDRAGGGAEGAGEGFRLDPEGSWVVAVTDRAGMLGFLGHRHAVLVTEWTAEVDWRPDEPAASRATVTVPARGLRIDTARSLELAGLRGGPDGKTVAELQEKLLSPRNLAAEEHPELGWRLTRVEGRRGGDLRVEGELTLRGESRAVRFPVKVEEGRGGAAVFSGRFTVRQSDFGITPESVAGVVKVADPVEIRFRVVLR